MKHTSRRPLKPLRTKASRRDSIKPKQSSLRNLKRLRKCKKRRKRIKMLLNQSKKQVKSLRNGRIRTET